MKHLMHNDCLEALKSLKENSIDSLITDPPAGISFMGKDWDSDKGGSKQWVAWMTEVMTECLRVMKPGAHGLVWAIPRTSHWTATACENAGFEIRDVCTHLFGSGFPKSLDVSKAIDKRAGAEREVVGPGKRHNSNSFGGEKYGEFVGGIPPITAPSTDLAKQWQGWGTALKPSTERWVLVRKPKLTVDYINEIEQYLLQLEEDLCSKQTVLRAGKNSKHTKRGSKKAKANSAQGYAEIHTEAAKENKTATGAAESLLERMDTSQLESAIHMSLSTVSSWKNILAASLPQENTSTTETKTRQIIDWETLSCCLLKITAENIILAASNQSGDHSNVRAVAKSFLALKLLSNETQTLFAQEHAGELAAFKAITQNELLPVESAVTTGPLSEDYILIRKPLSEKTVAANVEKWGCGGINIDGSRISVSSNDPNKRNATGINGGSGSCFGVGNTKRPATLVEGRFPANLLLSHSLFCTDDKCDERCPVAMLDEQSGERPSRGTYKNRIERYQVDGQTYKFGGNVENTYANQTGGASRFFYCAKASKSERNKGLEGMPVKSGERNQELGANASHRQANQKERAAGISHVERQQNQNHHPTVKPQKLMQYLIRLITPPKGVVLDPFMGSGSTGVAAKTLGFKFIGIEREKEYLKIAERRIEAAV